MKEPFYLLPPLQQQVLRYAYEDDLDDDEIGRIYGISKYQAGQRIVRAVLSLTQLMNDDPYDAGNGQWVTRSKGRSAMSNAAARRLTGGYWGDYTRGAPFRGCPSFTSGTTSSPSHG